ncbi:hypothetical protein MOQ_005850 [Trypanosoma cruzi marinkellei]|uniref:protein-histidine N-methyltransferase n=1 Tax=Trypanosoma cruzi marinkellei TaxID=85056 RepID=K2NNB2_TRYCR|nr:hypothetical protein MOQ_005850 [Trypanosoma cruzi marinkellei]
MSSKEFLFTFNDDDNDDDDDDAVKSIPPSNRKSTSTKEPMTVPAVFVSNFPLYSLTSQLLENWAECYPKSPRDRMELPRDVAGMNTPSLVFQRAPDVSELTTEGDRLERRDIIPGKYYGGLKVWSCAPYLVAYMFGNRDMFRRLFEITDSSIEKTTARKPSPDGQFAVTSSTHPIVAEVGCGQGLPGIAALLLGARRVIFQDYNKEVLEMCVKSNIGANLLRHAEFVALCENPPSSCLPVVQMVSGDWSHLQWQDSDDGTGKKSHDVRCKVVLGSDVTFDEEACEKLAEMLERCLSPAAGVAYIASKQYYFGTNGGALEFQKCAEARGLQVEEVSRMDEAGGMQRLIMRVERRG